MKDLSTGITAILFYLSILGACIYGWVLNILALTNMEPFIWTAKSVIGIGGVFVPPIGIIMGYFVW